MEWGAIIAGVIGIASTLVKHFFDKRKASREEVEKWGRVAFYLVLAGEQALPSKSELIAKWRATVIEFAEDAGLEIAPKDWRRLTESFTALHKLEQAKVRAKYDGAIQSFVSTAGDAAKFADKLEERLANGVYRPLNKLRAAEKKLDG